jgi:hypothetical protein
LLSTHRRSTNPARATEHGPWAFMVRKDGDLTHEVWNMIGSSIARRSLAAGLSIAGAVIILIASFQTWFRFYWHAGVVGSFVTTFNLYQLSTRHGSDGPFVRDGLPPWWNAHAPGLVLCGVVVLMLSGVATLNAGGPSLIARAVPLVMLIGIVLVVVGSIKVQPPYVGGFPISRGPGLWDSLVGAGLAVTGLIVVVSSWSQSARSEVMPQTLACQPLKETLANSG